MGLGKINCSITLVQVENNIEGIELSFYFARIYYANLIYKQAALQIQTGGKGVNNQIYTKYLEQN